MNLLGIKAEHAAWLVILTAWLARPAYSQEASRERGVLVEEVRNEQPAFMVRVDVDHPNRVYRGGEEMRVQVRSEKAGYLYLIYCDATGNVCSLFPNRVEQNNYIPAGQAVFVPPPGGGFRLRIGPPFGQELLKAIVSLTPLSPDQVKGMLRGDNASKVEGVKAVYVEMKSQPAVWAEHDVSTTTVPPDGAAPGPQPGGPPPQGSATAPGNPAAAPQNPAGPPRRVGVFIGISDFQDPQIRDLKASENDALAMADVMKRACGFDEVWTLIGRQATLRNIEEAVRRRLPAATRPGDVVVIYWSGHGGRCADDNGDERDGYDEYLVPYDGRWADEATIRRTMLLDDTFGRWVQELDGRRLVIILDTCHSGGQTSQEKALGKGLGNPQPAGDVNFDFLDGELERAKDIGQDDTALLASSRASQVSFERREGDMSTMTYFLVQDLSRGSGPVTLTAAYESLKREVAGYVESMFPGTTQTPVLVDNMNGPFYLRP